MAAVPGIRPPKCLPFGLGLYVLLISIIYGKSPFTVGGGGRGPDHLAQLEKHPFVGWRLCLASDLLNIAYWGKGGGGVVGGGESVLFPCVTICIVLLCLSMHVCDIDFCPYCFCMPVIYLFAHSYCSFLASVFSYCVWPVIYLVLISIYYMFVEIQALQSLCYMLYIFDKK